MPTYCSHSCWTTSPPRWALFPPQPPSSRQISHWRRTILLAAAWLRANYCFEARVGHVDLYRRRDGAACATRYFPCPHPPLSHWGEPLFVPMPPIVDREGSGLLGVGPPDVPKGFAPDERPWACPP